MLGQTFGKHVEAVSNTLLDTLKRSALEWKEQQQLEQRREQQRQARGLSATRGGGDSSKGSSIYNLFASTAAGFIDAAFPEDSKRVAAAQRSQALAAARSRGHQVGPVGAAGARPEGLPDSHSSRDSIDLAAPAPAPSAYLASDGAGAATCGQQHKPQAGPGAGAAAATPPPPAPVPTAALASAADTDAATSGLPRITPGTDLSTPPSTSGPLEVDAQTHDLLQACADMDDAEAAAARESSQHPPAKSDAAPSSPADSSAGTRAAAGAAPSTPTAVPGMRADQEQPGQKLHHLYNPGTLHYIKREGALPMHAQA